MSWFFVDDFPDTAGALSSELGRGAYALTVEVVSPEQARERLLTQKVKPAGVLMDVDLSNAQGERGSGPGIAQDLRVKQKAGEILEYPIVRFAYRQPVEKHVKGDPVTDDLFDLKIQKEEVPKNRTSVQHRLIGLESVYDGLGKHRPPKTSTIAELLGLEEAALTRWSHQGFHDRLLSALDVATHVAAGSFMRGFLTPTGLLLREGVLSLRLGVDAPASGQAWQNVKDGLAFRYRGIAADHFPRWWARGLDEWWFETIKSDSPLASLTIAQRIETLKAAGVDDLVALKMPKGSAGDKPWRPCALNLEANPPVLVPVDPAEGVRLTPRADMPVWTDPPCAALGWALQEKDFRLNRSDLDRLRRMYKV